MNILKKALILCLALCMVLTSCVSAFAFDGIFDLIGRSKADNSTYVAFGDSITRGCNGYTDDDVSLDDYTSFGQRNVAFSYSYQLSKMLGYSAENIEDDNDITKKDARYWPIAQNAITTAFVLDLLGVEDFYTDKDYLFADHYMSETYYNTTYQKIRYTTRI